MTCSAEHSGKITSWKPSLMPVTVRSSTEGHDADTGRNEIARLSSVVEKELKPMMTLHMLVPFTQVINITGETFSK